MLRGVAWALAVGAVSVSTAAPPCNYVVLPLGGAYPPVYLKAGVCSMVSSAGYAVMPVCEADGSLSLMKHQGGSLCGSSDVTNVYDEWVSTYNHGQPLTYSCGHQGPDECQVMADPYLMVCQPGAVLPGTWFMTFIINECTPYDVNGKTGAFKITGPCSTASPDSTTLFYDDTQCTGASTEAASFWIHWKDVLGTGSSTKCLGACGEAVVPSDDESPDSDIAVPTCSAEAWPSQHCFAGDSTHKACATCGFYFDAADAGNADDCITCQDSGDEIDVVYSDCTGYCVPRGTAAKPTASSSCTPPAHTTPCTQSDGAAVTPAAAVLLTACSVLAWLQ